MNFLDRFNLRPNEKRLVVIILIVLFLVLNFWFIVPQFHQWTPTQLALASARQKLINVQNEIENAAQYQKEKDKLEGQGGALLPEEAGIQLRRTVDAQVNESGIVPNGINDQAPKTSEDSIFEERAVTMGFVNTGEKELIDFLYNISKERSMIRVRDLNVRPDPPLQHLQGSMTLVASYQKKSSFKPKPKAAPAPEKKAEAAPAKNETKAAPKLPAAPMKNPAVKTNKPAITPKPLPESSKVERSPLKERSAHKEP